MAAPMRILFQRSFPTYSAAFRRNSRMAVKGRSNHTHSGKVALVTGSTEGIGFAIARRLGQDGAKVVVNSRKQEKVDAAVEALRKESIEVIGVAGHAGKSDDRKNIVAKAVEKFGGLDVLVNNVASSPYVGLTSETPEAVWDKLLDTNVKSCFFMSQECIPHLKKRGGGNIVFVSSITAYQHFDLIGVYSITKTALLGMIKALSTELAPDNIRVNGIAPGVIDTKFSHAFTSSEGPKQQALSWIPLKRFGLPEDCSGAVSFLASEDAAYITGETIVIAGGMKSSL